MITAGRLPLVGGRWLGRALVLLAMLAHAEPVLAQAEPDEPSTEEEPELEALDEEGTSFPPPPWAADLERLPTVGTFAIGGGQPLDIDTVFASVERHHPSVLDASQRLAAAEAMQMEARGAAFDPRLTAQLKGTPAGYYNYLTADVSVEQATSLWGSRVYAGWRIARSDERGIPVYELRSETLTGGELRAGAVLPVYRNGPIDEDRAAIRAADLARQAQQGNLDSERLRLLREAGAAYYDWVVAGLKIRIAQELLALAEARDTALRASTAAGQIAPVSLLENGRAILKRRQKLVASHRKLESTAIKLSLYLRTAEGTPFVPPPSAVPGAVPTVDGALPGLDLALDEASARRPEVAALRAEAAQRRVELELAENQVAPKLDLNVELSRDLGTGDEEPTFQTAQLKRLSPTTVELGLKLEVPLLFRKERGKRDAAEAKVTGTEAKLRFAQEKVQAEVRDAESAVRAASAQRDLADEAANIGARLVDAERERFDEGATELLIVNLREQSAADAQEDAVEARGTLEQAKLDLLLAVGRLLSR